MKTFISIAVFIGIYAISISCTASQDKDLINRIAQDENYGLIVFYASECGKCDVQIEEVDAFFKVTMWKTFSLIDLNPNTGSSLYNREQLTTIASKYSVDTVPEIWFVHKSGLKSLVGYGYTPMEIIEERIANAYFAWRNEQ